MQRPRPIHEWSRKGTDHTSDATEGGPNDLGLLIRVVSIRNGHTGSALAPISGIEVVT